MQARTSAFYRSACPHDCPSTCALEIEVTDGRIGKVRGAVANDYTAGVICAKVARYAERANSAERLLHPMMRTGPKGSGQFAQISWDEALDRIAEKFLAAERAWGAQTVWPYHFAGTMGLVQRDGIHRLRHLKRYSRQHDTICTNMAWSGYVAGTGKLAGPDPREMAETDCLVIWGTNPVSTQVNVMTHAVKARKTRGAKIVVVDVYRTETARQADMALILRPGTDAALACAVMHIAFRDGYADRAYMARYADDPAGLEAHLATRTPEWAAAITGLSVGEIEAFGKLIGTTARTFLRLGYGFTRSRNGTVAMHAAASIATVLGLWQRRGAGAFHNNGAIYKLDKSLIEASDAVDPGTRQLDQSLIGAILTGEKDALLGGPPVTAMLVQNTNPMVVAPDQLKVAKGFAREDLFVAVHEQVMTETAKMADIVLPATMFTEHDDIYKGGGHQYILLGPKLVDAPGEARENHFVHCELSRRLGVDHPGDHMTPREHIDAMISRSGYDAEALERDGFIDVQPPFDEAHYVHGFGHAEGKFHFAPDWSHLAAPNAKGGNKGPVATMPRFPDHWAVTEAATDEEPFRLVTAPARSFLNSSFNEIPSGRRREGEPAVLIHPDDAGRHAIADGASVRLSNARGAVSLTARHFDGVQRGTLIAEGLHANAAFADGIGINALTGADPVAPHGGAAFHDNRVAIKTL